MTTDRVQWPHVVVRHHDARGQTINDSYGMEKAIPDLLLIINLAEHPPNQPPPAGMVLYLEPWDSSPRKLPDNAWQLCLDQPCAPQAFRQRAEEVARLLIKALCEPGLACVDLVDLRLLLNQNKMKSLRCMVCDWRDPRRLPERVTNARYEHALAVVLTPSHALHTDVFAAAGHLLEQMVTEGVLLLAARACSSECPRILMIGYCDILDNPEIGTHNKPHSAQLS